MLWTIVVGFLVFMALVLLMGGEWWSSSKGVLKEKNRDKPGKAPDPPEPGA